MKGWKVMILVQLSFLVLSTEAAVFLIRHGFSAVDEPTRFEKVVGRAERNLEIPASARHETNPERSARGVYGAMFELSWLLARKVEIPQQALFAR